MDKQTTPERKRVEMLTDVKHEGGVFFAGELRVLDTELARYFCENGWAKDTSGEQSTGAVDTSPKTLDVKDAQHPTKAPKVK